MSARLVNVDHDTPLLLPVDLRDWVAKDHLVHFVMDAVEQLDVSKAELNERGTGCAQYPPGMLLGLLIYSYATGMFSSRQIERATYENVAVRMLCADTHPDHDTLCTFRRRNGELLRRAFAQVLELAMGCGVLRVGKLSVAVDGTKVLANASKHASASYAWAGERMKELELEIAELVAKAENADSTPLEEGLSLPAEIMRRQDRRAQLAAARAEIEARAFARQAVERAEHALKVQERAQKRAAGKKPRGKEPQPPSGKPEGKDQTNFTDPESRIMPESGGGFEQCYNAQAGVEVNSRLIVGVAITQAVNDKQLLAPGLAMIVEALGTAPAQVLIDSGYVSEAAVAAAERDAQGNPTGIEVLASMGRQPHGRTVAELEQRDDPPEPAAEAPFAERMKHRVSTKAGRARYALRMQTVEPVFGIIKEAMGFRRFSLRGLAKVSVEWTLVTLAYNLRRLHRLGAELGRPVAQVA